MAKRTRLVKARSPFNRTFTMIAHGPAQRGQGMSLGTDARDAVKSELCGRIDRLAAALPHLTPSRLAFAVDDIRRIARDHDLRALAALARGLESAIAMSGGAAMVLPYLEAMSDAAGCESIDPAITQSYLASVGVRLAA